MKTEVYLVIRPLFDKDGKEIQDENGIQGVTILSQKLTKSPAQAIADAHPGTVVRKVTAKSK